MSWVKRTGNERSDHPCPTPMREAVYTIPPPPPVASGKGGGGGPTTWSETVVDGELRDLWRCDDCRKLWRVGLGCDDCDRYGRNTGACVRGGYHAQSRVWRPATRLQRLRHRS